jgi:hypothetical protein
VDAPTFDLVAASLRADATDLRAFVEALAERLAGAFPDQVRIERSGNRFSSTRRVRRIQLALGDERYELEQEDGRVSCRRRALVRNVAIRSEELDLGAWIDELSRALVAQAESSAQARFALAELLE